MPPNGATHRLADGTRPGLPASATWHSPREPTPAAQHASSSRASPQARTAATGLLPLPMQLRHCGGQVAHQRAFLRSRIQASVTEFGRRALRSDDFRNSRTVGAHEAARVPKVVRSRRAADRRSGARTRGKGGAWRPAFRAKRVACAACGDARSRLESRTSESRLCRGVRRTWRDLESRPCSSSEGSTARSAEMRAFTRIWARRFRATGGAVPGPRSSATRTRGGLARREAAARRSCAERLAGANQLQVNQSWNPRCNVRGPRIVSWPARTAPRSSARPK